MPGWKNSLEKAEQQHSMNSAGHTIIDGRNKARSSSLLFWSVPFGWTMPQ